MHGSFAVGVLRDSGRRARWRSFRAQLRASFRLQLRLFFLPPGSRITQRDAIAHIVCLADSQRFAGTVAVALIHAVGDCVGHANGQRLDHAVGLPFHVVVGHSFGLADCQCLKAAL